MVHNLEQRLADKTATLGVVGLGYLGLTLAVAIRTLVSSEVEKYSLESGLKETIGWFAGRRGLTRR